MCAALLRFTAGAPGYYSTPPHPDWKPGDKQPVPYVSLPPSSLPPSSLLWTLLGYAPTGCHTAALPDLPLASLMLSLCSYDGQHQVIIPSELKSAYFLMISAFVPRPIALVSSLSAAGVGNVAPYSYSGCVAHDPPTLVVSCCRRPDGRCVRA